MKTGVSRWPFYVPLFCSHSCETDKKHTLSPNCAHTLQMQSSPLVAALCALTFAFLRTCPRTVEGFWLAVCRRSSEALFTGREHDSVSLVSQLEKGEDSWVRRRIAGDYRHTDKG